MKPVLRNHCNPASSRKLRDARECARTPGQRLQDRDDFHNA